MFNKDCFPNRDSNPGLQNDRQGSLPLAKFGLIKFGLANFGLAKFGLANFAKAKFGLANFARAKFGLAKFPRQSLVWQF